MPEPRVAIIAIHGVGDHQPFEMGKAVADMLEDLEDGRRRPCYGAFSETRLLINVAPVKTEGHAFASPGSNPNPGKHGWGPFSSLLRKCYPVSGPSVGSTNSTDHLFMESQLARFRGEGPEATYEALRVEGKRAANAASGSSATDVHVYDMFWSDLSGVGTAGLRIFGELYQLLFHLGSVGVNNVLAAALAFQRTEAAAAWKRFATAQKAAASMLAWPIPILNLVSVAFLAGLLADSGLVRLAPVAEAITVGSLLLVAVAAGWGYLLFRRGKFGAAQFRWPVIAFLVSCAALVAASLLQQRAVEAHIITVECTATLAAVLVAFIALQAVLRAYEKLRPGTMKFFAWLLVVLAGSIAAAWRFLPDFLPQGDPYLAMTLCLRGMEVTFWLLSLSWISFWVLLVAAFCAGFLAVQTTISTDKNEEVRARNTNWTARLTIALPAVLFLLITFAAWAGIANFSASLVPHPKTGPPVCTWGSIREADRNTLCYSPLFPKATYPFSYSELTGDILKQQGVGYIPILLLLVVGAIVISLYGLIPSVIGEVSPSRGSSGNLERDSEALGNWLDQGYRFMRWAGRFLYVGIFLFPTAVILPLLNPDDAHADWTQPFAKTLGAMVVGAGIGILGFRGRLSKLALGLRPVVRVALDVDNWLREHPRESNPTARICGRYISLLRYIAQWRDADGCGYDTLIIFAHSQGTVITADLLRFIQTEANTHDGRWGSYDSTLSGLDHMKLRLFTVGCPLRQLYALRFPYLYDYAQSGDPVNLFPDPDSLGVDQWVNAYRTGDYVGRYLWRPHPWQPVGAVSSTDWDPAQGIPANIWTEGKRVEFSIGPGAHTHYWDSTAEPIALTLDALIRR